MSDFASVFSLDPSAYPYTKNLVQNIKSNRQKLSGDLFFDMVLTNVVQISASTAKLYPPRTIADLRSLYEAIHNGPASSLKKQCSIYYILQDWSGAHLKYAQTQLIPVNFCALMDSYWYLDHLRCKEALNSLLTHGLQPNFTTKILETFLSEKQYAIAVRFVRTVQPVLDTEDKIKFYAEALLQCDVRSAIMMTRTVNIKSDVNFSRMLLEAILKHSLETKENAMIIANFPFNKDEEQWVSEFLQTQRGYGIEVLALRLTFLGQTLKALELRQKYGGGRVDITRGLERSSAQIEQKIHNIPATNAS